MHHFQSWDWQAWISRATSQNKTRNLQSMKLSVQLTLQVMLRVEAILRCIPASFSARSAKNSGQKIPNPAGNCLRATRKSPNAQFSESSTSVQARSSHRQERTKELRALFG